MIIVVLAGLLLPALASAREESRKAACKENLSQIGKAIFAFTQNNNEHFPPSFEALYPVYLDSFRVLRCPSTEGGTYVYGGPVDPNALSNVPLAWDAPGAHEGGGHILYVDGHVSWKGREYEAVAGPVEAEEADEAKEIGVRGKLAFDAARASEGQAAEPTQPPPAAKPKSRDDFAAKAQRAEVQQQEVAARGVQHMRARKLAESYLKRGEYGKAREQYQRALEFVPESREAQEGLARVDQLRQMAPTVAQDDGRPLAGPAREEKVAETRKYAAGALFTLSDKLQQESGRGWDRDLTETQLERDLLELVIGSKDKVDLEGKASVVLRENELVIIGAPKQVTEVSEAAGALRARMLDRSRQITVQKKRREAEQAARRRAALKARQPAAGLGGRGRGGTIRGSRAAGAMPLEISFPSLGTKAYPFHMDYAGTSQARIELTCVRAGAAMVLQGIAGLLVLVGVAGLSWRRPRIGLAGAVLLALLLAFLMKTAGEAPKQYVVMALAGVALALPFVLARLANRWRGEGR